LNATEIGQQAAGQAGGTAKKAGSKVASKAVGKAGKYLKKLMMKFIKQLLMSLGKMFLAVVGPWALAILVAILVTLAVMSAIPFSDWFLGGNERSETQKNADLEYQQEFKSAADETVAELWEIEADKNWITQVANTVKPSWGIPAALVHYEIVVNEKKVKLSDYKPNKLIENFKPTFSYSSINDDKERIKSVKVCTNKKKDKDGKETTSTTTTTDISESTRPSHDVLSNITLPYASMEIKQMKRYYPGGTLQQSDQWENSGSSTSGDCTTTTYRQYEHTTVDDRFTPGFVVDGPKFQQILIDQGVAEDDMKLFYEFIHTADRTWNPALYGGKASNNYGDYGDFYGDWLPGRANVPAVVRRFEPLVRKYLAQVKLEEHTELLLALIMQESSGTLPDVMQSSESKGLPPGAITDPEYSIQAGVEHFKDVYTLAKGDIKITLQAYNFGRGFVSYAQKRGGYSKEVAYEFSAEYAIKYGWKSYGDKDYVDHVLRYYNATDKPIKVKVNAVPGEQIFDVQQVLDIMSEYMGTKYWLGGKVPTDPGFDCSGLMSYAFGKIGIDLSGNAHTQYNKTVAVKAEDAKPGDLLFWETYKKAPSHVGMYLGDGKFINSAETFGVSIDTLTRWRKVKFLGYRRIVK